MTGDYWQQLWEVLTLTHYNTRLVVLSTLVLGVASGIVGSFLLMRKQSLMGDALSHACLPGIAIAFLILVFLGRDGRNLPLLLLGAALSGLAGVALVSAIRQTTRLKDDAAMGIILSVFFGLGVVLLAMIQEMPTSSAAGLEQFIYGKTASMVIQDFWWIFLTAVAVIALTLLMYKEWLLLCFDSGYAASQGWPVRRLDFMLLVNVAAVTVVGLQAVGLILIIAFLITPAAAARFWTNDLRRLMWVSAVIGGASGWAGSSLSALLPNLPAGAVIVLVAAALFVVSMLFGPARGILPRYLDHRRLLRKEGRQHLLRSIYEILETQVQQGGRAMVNEPISMQELLRHRSWTPAQLQRWLRMARAEDHLEATAGDRVQLSEAGFGEAIRTTRNHRLWERYLIEYADIAPSHVDRDADAVEHILGAEMVRRLESKLAESDASVIPQSPHPIFNQKDT